MTKTLLLTLALLCPVLLAAQNVWDKPEVATEKPAEQKAKKQKAAAADLDAPYLAGAVALRNGEVAWTTDISAPGKTAQELYDIMLRCLTDLTRSHNQLAGSSVALVNKQEHIIVASVKEWLTFKETFLSVDKTKFYYTLIVTCHDNSLTVSLERLSYKYDVEGVKGGQFYKAEGWIDDKAALNKKGTKLIPGSAKFRRKTIDRKDELFDIIRRTATQ